MIVKDIDISKNVPKQALLDDLKCEADTIHVTDIMAALAHLKEESIYIQSCYREKYNRIYIESFLMRIKEIRNSKKYYEGSVQADELQKAIKILEKQAKQVDLDQKQHIRFFKIYLLITIYTTFILDEPIHPVGMPFPGGFKIKHYNGTYYCPVKESQKDNPGAVCGICIAEQDPDV